MLQNSNEVYYSVPKIIKNNIQFVVDMKRYMNPESQKSLKLYVDCGL